MNIRKYKHSDKENVLALIRMNTPEYFAPEEELEFVLYLENELEDYFVVEDGVEIVGCGGINYFVEEKKARIAWDMVHPEHQGKGIGKLLTQYRIDFIKENSDVLIIVVRTSQLAQPFYKKLGFILMQIEKDFWAKGFDLYLMELPVK